jgi:hypothetical protein
MYFFVIATLSSFPYSNSLFTIPEEFGSNFLSLSAVLNAPRQIFRPEAAPICRGALESRGSGILPFQGVCICRKISITADLKNLSCLSELN